MKIIEEVSLRNFEFWSGAIDNANQLTCEELDELEQILEDTDEEWTETAINDFMWFDFETICEMLGLELDDNGDVLREEDKQDFEIRIFNIKWDEEHEEDFGDLETEKIITIYDCFEKDLEDEIEAEVNTWDYCVNSYEWEKLN